MKLKAQLQQMIMPVIISGHQAESREDSITPNLMAEECIGLNTELHRQILDLLGDLPAMESYTEFLESDQGTVEQHIAVSTAKRALETKLNLAQLSTVGGLNINFNRLHMQLLDMQIRITTKMIILDYGYESMLEAQPDAGRLGMTKVQCCKAKDLYSQLKAALSAAEYYANIETLCDSPEQELLTAPMIAIFKQLATANYEISLKDSVLTITPKQVIEEQTLVDAGYSLANMKVLYGQLKMAKSQYGWFSQAIDKTESQCKLIHKRLPEEFEADQYIQALAQWQRLLIVTKLLYCIGSTVEYGVDTLMRVIENLQHTE